MSVVKGPTGAGARSRREEYSEATRAALLAAATRRFASDGFAGTALEEVAADVRATRGAVYHHFASKTALFQAVYEELETDLIARATAAIAAFPPGTSAPGASASGASPPGASAPGAARQAARAALDVFLDRACDPVYGRIVWREAPLALGWHRWRECEERYAYGLVEQMAARLMDSGDIPRLPLEPVARIMFHALGAAGHALTEADPADKERVRAEYAAVLPRMFGGLTVLSGPAAAFRVPGRSRTCRGLRR